MSYAIVCQACDRYESIFKTFLDCIEPHLYHEEKNTGQIYARTLFFATEEIDVKRENVVNIKTGPGSWSKRLRTILESPELSDYSDCLYLQEDFLITNIDWTTVNKAYQFHKFIDADITKLGRNHEFHTFGTQYKIRGHEVTKQREKDTYLLSHQPIAFFNKDFLLRTLVEDCGPSEHEINTSKNIPAEVYCVGKGYYPTNKSDIITYLHAVRRGELLPEAAALIEKMNAN